MPAYSHRDHRVYRAAYRLLATVGVVTTMLVGLSLAAPWPAVGEAALLALAALGGAALLASGAIVDGYVEDLQRAELGDAAPRLLRLEVESRIELERPVFVGAHTSPHARRRRPEPAPGAAGLDGLGEHA